MKGPYTKSADIWSLGILLYFMATGQLPFAGQPLPRLMQSLVDEVIPIPPTLSSGLADLLGHLLQRDPAHRIAIEDILEHPWLCDGLADLRENKLARFQPLIEDLTIDDAIVDELQQIGIDTSELGALMERGEFNDVTALYRIKRRIREMQRLACRPSRVAGARRRFSAELPDEQLEMLGAARQTRPRKPANRLFPVRRSILAPSQRRIVAGQLQVAQEPAAPGDGCC
jgi:hypothetical protein